MGTLRKLARSEEDALDSGFVLEVVMRGPDEQEKARRLETAEMSVATDVEGDQIHEEIRERSPWHGKQGKERELAVTQRYIEFKNARGASLLAPPYVPDDPTWDALVYDESNSEPLRIQVVVSETDTSAQRALRSKREIARNYESLYVQRMLRVAVSKKSNKYDSGTRGKTILLLEGWPSVRKGDLEMFRTSHAEDLRKSGFKEIWFVGPNGCPVEQLL